MSVQPMLQRRSIIQVMAATSRSRGALPGKANKSQLAAHKQL
jgi:hypothetical protein